MGSRMMHLIIANQVFEKLEIPNQQRFLLGGIAPDAAFTPDSKNKSHFFEGRLDEGTRFVNYKRFIEKYQADIQDEFILGYLTHLISDDFWLKFIYFKNDFYNRLATDPELLGRWHDDFRKLNGKLIEKFECGELKNKLVGANLDNKVCEINSEDLQSFTIETLNDFTYNKEDIGKELQVYTFREINDYIALATDSAVKVCRSVIYI